jgi:hypothetical protein
MQYKLRENKSINQSINKSINKSIRANSRLPLQYFLITAIYFCVIGVVGGFKTEPTIFFDNRDIF